jgi:hypothetical protein
MNDCKAVQKFVLKKLLNFSPAKWGASHTEITNVVKGLTKHIRGQKFVKKAISDLIKKELLLSSKKTNQIHVSLNPEKQKEIYEVIYS